MIASINKLYRQLFCRGGYGIHSPFVFDLITEVIEEQKPYYCYEPLHAVRLQLLQNPHKVNVHNRTLSIKKAIKTYSFTEGEDRLLFRLANRFQPKKILIFGSNFGLTPLYLTAYSKDSVCIIIEPEPSISAIADEYLKKYATASVVLHNNCKEIPAHLDFIVWDNSFTMSKFESFLSHISDNSVMVIAGINASSENRKVWKAVCVHPKVTVTIDFYRFGVVFFNPKYHQKTYQSVVVD